MKTITSRQNPEIVAVANLANPKKRAEQGMFIAEGIRTCAALVASPIKLAQLYVTEPMVEQAQKIAKDTKITVVHESVMEKIAQTSTPSGMVGVFIIPPQPSFDRLTSGLVLARVSDPGNMGTLIRSCVAFGVHTVVVVEGVDPWSPKVVQASAGTIGLVTVFALSWKELLEIKDTYSLCALTVKGGQKPSELETKDALLVIGSEAHGIPTEWLQDCEYKVTLPMPGKAESLNAAIAGSIALYEIHGK
ncbi:MAG TPA: RNA methyltransferase [Candidatus Limnocylindria bacterium]|nr:RNA methyltransferase [Candidatus Limnocylindria bacterium]